MAFSAAEIVHWQYEVAWSAKKMNGRVVKQAGKGASESRDNWPYVALQDLRVGRQGAASVERRGGWFLWLVWRRRGDRWDLRPEDWR